MKKRSSKQVYKEGLRGGFLEPNMEPGVFMNHQRAADKSNFNGSNRHHQVPLMIPELASGEPPKPEMPRVLRPRPEDLRYAEHSMKPEIMHPKLRSTLGPS